MANIRTIFRAASLCAALLLAMQAHGADPQSNGIAFLHLKLTGDGAELISFEVTPGRLKPGPQHGGERILIAVESATGAPLWRGTINDPRTQVIEHADETGQLTRKVIERSAPEVTARVPFFEEGQVVRVTRVTPQVGVAQEKVLGTFRLGK